MNDDLASRCRIIVSKISIDQKRKEAREIEAAAEKPDYWVDSQKAAGEMRRLAVLQKEIADLEIITDWLTGGATDGQALEVEKIVKNLETTLYLSGRFDHFPAIFSLHSGQGGVEAMDWVSMLYRMYQKYFSSLGWKVEEIDVEPGSEAGYKTVTLSVFGDFAYGMLRYESGVHRLVRQSPFNADHLRQTSFALVEVMPYMEQNTDGVSIKEEDLDWDFFRAGGHGGQNVNKVSSAVRLTHRPTGIVVTCQKERDQSRNREIALKLLKAKLTAMEEEKQHEEKMRLKGRHVTPGWGNQIRSYVLHPYHLVKDLRTEYEETDSDSVLNGGIDKFIEKELQYFAKG